MRTWWVVGGATEVDPKADTSANKTVVLEFTKQVLQECGQDKLDQFVAEDLIQHASTIEAGRAGLVQWLSSSASGKYELLFQLIGQGDFVATFGKRHANAKDIAAFDLYRVANGQIVEQWQNSEEISPRGDWGDSGKF